MSDETDASLAALGRLGTQITTLADQFAMRLDRSEAAQAQTRAELIARIDRLQEAMTERAHDSTREKLRTVNETITLLIRRVWLLEADVRTLKGDP